MARLNKFATVNLNESYGKPDQAGSTNAGANSSVPGKSRLPTQGGMVVLTKPGRGPTTGSKSGRLGIPSPVNLPSLKREHSGGETVVSVATSPPLPPGWTKGSQGENLTGAVTEKPDSGNLNVLSSGVRSGSVDNITENLRSLSTSPVFGKPDVYAPPALRAIQANGVSTPRTLPPTTGGKAAVIRGEEFPTLQASLLRPPTPPQQSRQKESQQKQREKQQEIKEQQLKLQQLSHQQQEHAQKQFLDNPSQAGKSSLQLQPAQPFRPQVKQERSPKEVVSSLKHLGGSVDQTFVLSGGFGDSTLSKSPPLVRSSHASNWADDEREREQNDDERERGQILKHHNLSSSVQVGQDSSSIDIRPSGLNNEKESSWSSMHMDSLSSRNGDFTKNSRDFWTSVDGDTKGCRSKDGSDSRGFLSGRESYTSRGNSTSKDPSFTEYGGKEGYAVQEGFSNEWSGSRSVGKAIGPTREAVQGREGVYNRGWVGKDSYNRDVREPYVRDTRESYKRDVREPYNSDPKETHIRDNREIFGRDAKDMYKRDFREVHNADVNAARQVGYANFSDDGGNLKRAAFGDTMLHPGRGNFYGGVAANPGFGHDARYSRRYGFHSTGGDHPHAREARPGSASGPLHGRYAEPTVAHFSADGMGFRRTRSPAFDPERGAYEAEFDRLEDEQRNKFEEKLSSEDEGLGYTASKALQKGDDPQGLAGRGDQVDTGKKLEEERRLREDEKKQPFSEEERRKEAARRKLLELEERIARREAEERRKGEVEVGEKMEDKKIDDPSQGNFMAGRQEGLEEASLNLEYEEEAMGTLMERNAVVGWKELELPSKLARPSSASSSSSWTFRGAGEELSLEPESSLGAADSKFNQELKLVRSKSPISWRKEANANANANGNVPKSKLFSSPYIESGGFHRATDGGNYKLF